MKKARLSLFEKATIKEFVRAAGKNQTSAMLKIQKQARSAGFHGAGDTVRFRITAHNSKGKKVSGKLHEPQISGDKQGPGIVAAHPRYI